MSTRTLRAASAAAVGGLLLLGMSTPAFATQSTLPAPSSPLPAVAENAGTCEISDATLTWGVKESFRAYITGTIANGEWTTEGNASYETPSFSWTGGTGAYDPAEQSGSLNFTGTIKFSGHGGLLKVDLANPGIEIVDEDEAYLLVDLSSTKQTGESDVTLTQVRAATLDLPGAMSTTDTTLTIDAAPGLLTQEGASGFGGFYETGVALDPITVSATISSGCQASSGEAAAPEEEPTTPSETTEAPVSEDQSTATGNEAGVPWLPIGIGIAAVLVILAAAVALLKGNRKKGTTAEALEPSETAESNATEAGQAQESAPEQAPEEQEGAGAQEDGGTQEDAGEQKDLGEQKEQ